MLLALINRSKDNTTIDTTVLMLIPDMSHHFFDPEEATEEALVCKMF